MLLNVLSATQLQCEGLKREETSARKLHNSCSDDGVLLEAEVQEEDVATSLQVGSVTSPTTVAGCVPGSWCAWRWWPMVVALAVTHGEVVLEASTYRVLFR